MARKKFAGRPAARALARRPASASRPVLVLVPPGTYGCGLNLASGLMKLLLPNSGDV